MLQLIREIGITHGDESQVAYYVGIMVGSQCTLPKSFASIIFASLAICIFLDTSLHSPALE